MGKSSPIQIRRGARITRILLPVIVAVLSTRTTTAATSFQFAPTCFSFFSSSSTLCRRNPPPVPPADHFRRLCNRWDAKRQHASLSHYPRLGLVDEGYSFEDDAKRISAPDQQGSLPTSPGQEKLGSDENAEAGDGGGHGDGGDDYALEGTEKSAQEAKKDGGRSDGSVDRKELLRTKKTKRRKTAHSRSSCREKGDPTVSPFTSASNGQRKRDNSKKNRPIPAGGHRPPLPTDPSGGDRRRVHHTPLPTQRDATHDPILSLNLNLRNLLRSNERGAARRAEQLLLRVEKLHAEGYYADRPDVVSYNSVMRAWAASPSEDSAFRAEELLRRMEILSSRGDGDEDGGGIPSVRPNTRSYNTVMNAWARKSRRTSGRGGGDDDVVMACERADGLLRRMEALYDDSGGDVRVRPDTISYNTVIDAYAKAGRAREAEGVLMRMRDASLSGNVDVLPNGRTMNTVLHAWSRSRERGAADRALELLRRMEEEYDAGGNAHVKPTVFSYSIVISALARSGEAEEAERLLDRMEDRSGGGDDPETRPNVVTYSAVLNAWAKNRRHPDAAGRAERILDRMEHAGISPDVVAYTTVLNCYAKSGRPGSAAKAQALLEKMEDMYRRGGREEVKPNVRSYGAVIHAWARSCGGKKDDEDGAEMAHALLLRMNELYESSGDADVMPNAVCYNSVLDAYSRGDRPDKAERVRGLWVSMEEQYRTGHPDCIRLRPDQTTYNTVINACARTFSDGATGKRRAMGIAFDAFDSLHRCKFCHPNSVTYAYFLKACRNLLPLSKRRIGLVGRAFRLCCNDGMVNSEVLFRLRQSVPIKVYRELVRGNEGNDSLDIAHLPISWKQHSMPVRGHR